MLYDIIEVRPSSEYKLYLRFEDGTDGEIDISKLISFKGIFEKLADQTYFATVKVNPTLGTIVWDNGADISPCTLYKLIKH